MVLGLIALGAGLSVGLAALATGYAQARIGAAAMGAVAEKPELIGRAILLVAIPETLVILGFAVVVYNIVQVSYRQAICPPRLQGRMNSVMRFIVWGTIPIGALIGGVLGTLVGLRETIVVGAPTAVPTVVIVPSSPPIVIGPPTA